MVSNLSDVFSLLEIPSIKFVFTYQEMPYSALK